MKIVLLQEDKYYTSNDLMNKLNCSIQSFEILKTKLIESGLFYKKSLSKEEQLKVYNSLNTDEVETYNINDIVYKTTFVGIIKIKKIVLIIYPKYVINIKLDGEKKLKKIKKIIKVIMLYKNKNEQYYGHNNFFEEENDLGLLLNIVEDFNKKGLYSNTKETVEINGNGNINWNSTINSFVPMIIKNTPFYFNYETSNNEIDKNNFFRLLHQSILAKIKLDNCEIFDILDIELNCFSDIQVENFGNLDYIINNINNELNVQYITYKQETLKLLRSYLLNNFQNVSSEISLLGCSSFNKLWEDVCCTYYKNIKQKNLLTLNLTYKKFIQEDNTLISIIEKPKWIDSLENNHCSTHSMIPDIITIENNQLKILDAKYYNIILDDKQFFNYPGVEDLNKQYMYELFLHELMIENNIECIENAFLFPSDKDSNSIIGFAKLNTFENIFWITQKKIILRKLSCDKLYNYYLNHK